MEKQDRMQRFCFENNSVDFGVSNGNFSSVTQIQ